MKKPSLLAGGCWGTVTLHVSQLLGPDTVSCSKRPRPGHLTCHWHRDREAAARELEARIASREVES